VEYWNSEGKDLNLWKINGSGSENLSTYQKIEGTGIQMYVISAEELFIWLLLFLKYIP